MLNGKYLGNLYGTIFGVPGTVLVHLERAAPWLRLQIRAGRILYDLMHLQHIRPGKCFFRQGAGLSMAFDESVGAYPVEKVLAALPDGENHIRVALVDGA